MCPLVFKPVNRNIIGGEVGIRSRLGHGVVLRNTFVMGSDIYESTEELEADEIENIPPVGIGDGTIIENAIVDKNPRIGQNVTIRNEQGHDDFDDGVVSIRDGITVVPRNGVVPDGYTI